MTAYRMPMTLFGYDKAAEETFNRCPKHKPDIMDEIQSAMLRHRLRQTGIDQAQQFQSSQDSRFSYLSDTLKRELEKMGFTSMAKEFTWVDSLAEFEDENKKMGGYKMTLKWQISAEGELAAADMAMRSRTPDLREETPDATFETTYEWSKCKSEILTKMRSAGIDCKHLKFDAEEVELGDYQESRFRFLFEGLREDLRKMGFTSNIACHYLVDKRPGANGGYKVTMKWQMAAEDQ